MTLNQSTGLESEAVSREGCKGIRNKVKSKGVGEIDFQISSEEQRLDFCGMKKNQLMVLEIF